MKKLILLVSMLITVIAFGQNQKSLNPLSVNQCRSFENEVSHLDIRIQDIPVLNTKATNTSFTLKEEKDTPLKLEEWMMNENYFNIYSALIKTESDEQLVLEDWMINSDNFWHFNNNTLELEKALEIQAWMLDNNLWDYPQAICILK